MYLDCCLGWDEGKEHCGSCGRRGAVSAAAGVASLLEASERSTDQKIAGPDGVWAVLSERPG
jgi:hypothetical protein